MMVCSMCWGVGGVGFLLVTRFDRPDERPCCLRARPLTIIAAA